MSDHDSLTDQTLPIPAEDAPHAYVAIRRTHSVNADRPEWDPDAAVIPEWNADDINFARSQGYTLIPIAPDGDTGTRAIVEPAPTKPALRLVAGCRCRNPLGAELHALRPVLRELAGYKVLAAGIWVVEDFDPLFGTTEYLVTAEGMAACGYTLVTEEQGS